MDYEVYEKKFLSLLLEWKVIFKLWATGLEAELKEYAPTLDAKEKKVWAHNHYVHLLELLLSLHQNLLIIQNSEDIHKIYVKLAHLEKEMMEKFRELYKLINDLTSKIESLDGSSDPVTCSSFFGIISPISGLIPGAGAIFSAVTGIISAGCAIANA